MGKSEKKRQKREYVFNSKGVASPHSDDFRSLVAQEVLSGRLEYGEACKRFNVTKNSISSFIRWYKKNGQIERPILKPMTVEEQTEINKLREHLKETQASLKQADLRIVALETMVNIAEQELKVSIRKKYGTKQSK